MGNRHETEKIKPVTLDKPEVKFASETPPQIGDEAFLPPFWVQYTTETKKEVDTYDTPYDRSSWHSTLDAVQMTQHIVRACLPTYTEAVVAFAKSIPPTAERKKDPNRSWLV
jgi:hypothetical protein